MHSVNKQISLGVNLSAHGHIQLLTPGSLQLYKLRVRSRTLAATIYIYFSGTDPVMVFCFQISIYTTYKLAPLVSACAFFFSFLANQTSNAVFL